jgi:hypothetical protein
VRGEKGDGGAGERIVDNDEAFESKSNVTLVTLVIMSESSAITLSMLAYSVGIKERRCSLPVTTFYPSWSTFILLHTDDTHSHLQPSPPPPPPYRHRSNWSRAMSPLPRRCSPRLPRAHRPTPQRRQHNHLRKQWPCNNLFA